MADSPGDQSVQPARPIQVALSGAISEEEASAFTHVNMMFNNNHSDTSSSSGFSG